MPQELFSIPDKAQELPKKNRQEKTVPSKIDALEKELLENLENLEKELAEIKLYLQLGIKKVLQEKLLARQEELEILRSIYQGLLKEAQEKKQKNTMV